MTTPFIRTRVPTPAEALAMRERELERKRAYARARRALLKQLVEQAKPSAEKRSDEPATA